jgi:multiple sugar transport system permease protein/putative aldouronate transport system permease protein
LKSDKKKRKKLGSSYNWQFWAIIAVPVIYAFIFAYVPMAGIVIAFEKYSPRKGIFGSDWVGLKYFKQFFTTPSSRKIIFNTLYLGIYSLLAGFPIPILLAICLNEMRSKKYKKFIQMVTYAPYFISTVVLVGIMMRIFDLRTGLVNKVLTSLGFSAINFFGVPGMFPSLYVWSGIWQTAGYSSIIYIAALAGVSPELQEAAIVDGANRLQRILHVDLPCIIPTIITMLIFNCASIMSIGFDKVYLMQNDMNINKSQVISTFVYEVGLVSGDFSFSTAAGLFQSLVSFVLLVVVNKLCKLFTETSLW